MALLAGLLTVPVAGTALVIMDPYLTARYPLDPGRADGCGMLGRPATASRPLGG